MNRRGGIALTEAEQVTVDSLAQLLVVGALRAFQQGVAQIVKESRPAWAGGVFEAAAIVGLSAGIVASLPLNPTQRAMSQHFHGVLLLLPIAAIRYSGQQLPGGLFPDAQQFRRRVFRAGWERVADAAAMSRTWGDCFGYFLVATGRAEAMLDPVMSPWDAAAAR